MELLGRARSHCTVMLGAVTAVGLMLTPVSAATGAVHARAADSTSAPCVFWGAAHSCESTNPNVTLEVVNERETSLCTFHESWTWGDGGASGETTLRGSVEGSTQMLGTHTYGAPGTYTVSVSGYVVSEENGLEYTCEAPPVEYTFTLLPGVGVLGSQQASSRAPTITAVGQSHRVWREGSKLARISRTHRPPVGTVFSLALDQQATVRFSFTRERPMAKSRCRAKKPPSKANCRRGEQVGTFSFTGHEGVSKVSFQGRVSAAKKLAPGNYTLTIAATNAAGQQSAPSSLSFTIAQ
jgi:PKD repeat protein